MNTKPHYLSLLCVFKNEGHILKEWITHYLDRGFDHIYLINDNSTDGFLSVLSGFSPSKYTLYNNNVQFEKCGRQVKIYEKYSQDAISQSVWLAVLDLDEFLYSPICLNLKNIFLDFELQKLHQITVDWVHFGSSNRIHQPESVVNGFTLRQNLIDFKKTKHYGVKSIVYTKSLIGLKIHSHDVTDSDKTTLHVGWSTGSNVLLVNHYCIQSMDFFLNVKQKRGCVNRYLSTDERNLQMFRSLDFNDECDNRLMEQSHQVKLTSTQNQKAPVSSIMNA